MLGSKFARMGRPIIVGVAVLALWCSAAYAQVLDQVPSDAMVVIHINNLQQVNQKVIKLAHDWGLDEWQAEFKDPLEACMQKGQITKGINKAGEVAVAVTADEQDNPMPVFLIPVSDYKEFLSNFETVGGAENGVQEVKHPGGGDQNMFAAQRGTYAAMGPNKQALMKNPGGIKLQGAMQREMRQKDISAFINMPVVRQKYLGELQQNRQKKIDEFMKNAQGQEQLKAFEPVMKTVAVAMFDMAEQFLKDSQGVVISGNIDGTGILFSGMAQFTPDSKWGQSIAQMKNSNQPLLAGLPDGKYFAFGGMSWDPKQASQLAAQILDPIRKDLAGANEQGKQIASAIDAVKTMLAATNRVTAGYVVPEGGGFVQTVQIFSGDANKIGQSEKQIMDLSNNLMSGGPAAGVGVKMKSLGPKEVDGVTLNTYETSVEPDPNNPQAMQAKMIMQIVYGGPTLTTSSGMINDHTYIIVQGGNEQFLKEAIANAKGNKDALSSSQLVATVSRQLPQQRFCEEFISLDNIISAGVKAAKTFGLPFQIKVPADLPPLGFTAGSEGSAVRGDMYVPSQTVQSLIAAGIQAFQQFQKGGNGNL